MASPFILEPLQYLSQLIVHLMDETNLENAFQLKFDKKNDCLIIYTSDKLSTFLKRSLILTFTILFRIPQK